MKIIKEDSEKAGLRENSISLETVRSRVKRGNLDAFNPSQQSSIKDIEPSIWLGKMGNPLTKSTIIELANGLIVETEYQKKVKDCKELCKLQKTGKLSDAWCHEFLSQFSDQLMRSGTTIKDTKRNTWVIKDNFTNMYENVYQTMVEAGIAKIVEDKIQYDHEMPSKYKLTKPEYLLFIDETGCNTNPLNDGRVGGELFVVPKEDNEAGAPTESTTDLHITVIRFVSGTGELAMHVIIFKSDQKLSEIPINWKTGIDLMVEGADDHSKVMAGGPTCSYLGKTVSALFDRNEHGR